MKAHNTLIVPDRTRIHYDPLQLNASFSEFCEGLEDEGSA